MQYYCKLASIAGNGYINRFMFHSLLDVSMGLAGCIEGEGGAGGAGAEADSRGTRGGNDTPAPGTAGFTKRSLARRACWNYI